MHSGRVEKMLLSYDSIILSISGGIRELSQKRLKPISESLIISFPLSPFHLFFFTLCLLVGLF